MGKRGRSEKGSGVQLEVIHNRERSSAAAEAPKLKKCLKPKAAQICQTAISLSAVIRRLRLQIYYAHAAPSSMLRGGGVRRFARRLLSTPRCSCPHIKPSTLGPFLLTFLKECLHLLKLFPAKTRVLRHTYGEPVTNQF